MGDEYNIYLFDIIMNYSHNLTRKAHLNSNNKLPYKWGDSIIKNMVHHYMYQNKQY